MQTDSSTPNQRPAGFYAKVTLEMLTSTANPNHPSVYLRAYRIAGPKPWAGGTTTAAYPVKKLRILEAVAAAQLGPLPQTLELAVWENASGKTRITLDNQVLVGRALIQKDMHLAVVFPVSVSDLLRAMD